MEGYRMKKFRGLGEAIFTNPEGSQSGGVLYLPMRSGLIFAILEG